MINERGLHRTIHRRVEVELPEELQHFSPLWKSFAHATVTEREDKKKHFMKQIIKKIGQFKPPHPPPPPCLQDRTAGCSRPLWWAATWTGPVSRGSATSSAKVIAEALHRLHVHSKMILAEAIKHFWTTSPIYCQNDLELSWEASSEGPRLRIIVHQLGWEWAVSPCRSTSEPFKSHSFTLFENMQRLTNW